MTLIIRILLYNPVDPGKWFSIYAKVYTASTDDPTTSIFGHQYRGYWRFFNIFQTVLTQVNSNFYYQGITNTGASYVYPNKPLWCDLTTWYVTSNVPWVGGTFPAGQFMIF